MYKLLLAAFIATLSMTAVRDAHAACNAPLCTKVIDNGSDAGKRVMVILGDGYANADQNKYRQDVDRMIIDGVFGHDFYEEHENAFNVYRINLVSAQSGVSQRRYDEKGTPSDKSDDTIISTTMRNTALRYIYSGSWAHCWLERSPQTSSRLQNVLNATVPHADYVAIILNEDGGGGCGGGGFQVVTRGVSWAVMAHEFGHGIGGLFDEYTRPGTYTGDAVNNRNCSTTRNRNSVFWSRFIAPSTRIPTTYSSGMDFDETVGLFEGCRYRQRGIYRPVHNCRMRGNTPEFCPVCYTLMRRSLNPYIGFNFRRVIAGRFSADSRADIVVHNGQDLALYEKASAKHELHWKWSANNVVPRARGGVTWQPARNDRYYVGDFDGDGRDDLFVFNGSNWNKPYLGMLRSTGSGFQGVARYDGKIGSFWTMKSGDTLHVGDYNGDGKDDILIRNGRQWNKPYVGLLVSTGTRLRAVRRFDGSFSGWQMRKNDRIYVGDFNNDRKDDVYIFNGNEWSKPYLGMLQSSGSNLTRVKLYFDTLPGWTMKPGDRFYVADFNGDKRDDLYVANMSNWGSAYLLMVRSRGRDLAYVKRYDSSNAGIPGWQMRKGDRFYVSDANKDGKEDLFVYNPATNWSTEYLGTLTSAGSRLSGSWSADWVGGWNLGPRDRIVVANYEGGRGAPNLFIHNDQWLGMIRRNRRRFVMDRIYNTWIYSAEHDKKPWSNSLP